VSEPKGSGAPLKSIDQAAAMLRALGREPGARISELSRQAGMSEAHGHRLVSSLESAGFMERDPVTGRVRLGRWLAELGRQAVEQRSLWDESRPVLIDLTRAVEGATALMAVLDGLEAVYIEQIRSNGTARGRPFPAHTTSLGKVLLAHLPPADLDALLADHALVAHTANTITDPGALRAELEAVRRRGYATEAEEYDADLHSVAAPVRDHTGNVFAAIGVGGRSRFFAPDRLPALVKAVTSSAAVLSERLGVELAETFVPRRLPVARTGSPDAREVLPHAPEANGGRA
jgi:DNA-binding IclR family transcriptional regulator